MQTFAKKRNVSRTSWPSGPNESFASVWCVCFLRLHWPDNLAPIRISKLCSQNKSVLISDSCETTRDNMRFAWMNLALEYIIIIYDTSCYYEELCNFVCFVVCCLFRIRSLGLCCRLEPVHPEFAVCCKGPNVGSYGIALKACTQGHWA